MKLKIFIYSLLILGLFSCTKEDPCEIDFNSLECELGDFDEDGIANGEDADPSNACIPNLPTFENNLIGTWNYGVFGMTSTVKINADGTYEDVTGTIISNGDIASRTWRIEDEQLVFDVENASLMMSWLEEYDCDSFTLKGESFIPDIAFTRI